MIALVGEEDPLAPYRPQLENYMRLVSAPENVTVCETQFVKCTSQAVGNRIVAFPGVRHGFQDLEGEAVQQRVVDLVAGFFDPLVE
jgi:hypothetical protein